VDCFETIIEPFRIRAVEAIPLLTRDERIAALERAGHNLFRLSADEVTIDLLTDSGTGAMSAAQWGALMRGDESYAGSRSHKRLMAVAQDITGMPHVFPCHQGRAAERILMQTSVRPQHAVLNNTHFDTTRAHVLSAGAAPLDLPVPEALDPSDASPFKGDMDLLGLRESLDQLGDRVDLVLLTLTNNAAGGQPVSMRNLEAVSAICRERGVPFFLDAARYAENAWFIHAREPGWRHRSVRSIAQHLFSLADGFTMSAKKDGLVNIGGLLGTRDPDQAERFQNELILSEGFPTYGGLAGRDLEALAVGLEEALDEDYLRYRARSVAYLADGLQRVGLPVVRPPGGHAVFVDAGALLPHIPRSAFPAQALGAAFYVEGGVRGVEVGSLMLDHAARLELLRLALPRRVYTQAHIDYVIEVGERVAERAASLRGYALVEAPALLRHFSAVLAPCGPRAVQRDADRAV